MKKTLELPACRLKDELAAMGMETDGSRSDLVNRLHQAGVYEIREDVKYPPMHRNTYDPSSVYIGTRTGDTQENRFQIANPNHTILSGDFKKKIARVHDCLHIVETKDLSCDTPGTEGDMRLKGGILYMYRETDVEPGWYGISFGRPLLF
jgi:hypothetical protein